MRHHRLVSRIPRRAETEPDPDSALIFVLDVLIAALNYVGVIKRM